MADEMNDWRIGALLAEFSQLGAKHGSGLERLAFGEADAAARSELARHFELAGFHVRCDAIGNLFGFVLPPEGDEPLVLVGSHLDSQPDGGRFDGQIGVLAGLLVAIRLKRAGLIPAGVNLGVVN